MFCLACRTNFLWSQAPVYGMGIDWYLQQKKALFGIKKKADTKKEKNFRPNLSSPFKRRKALNDDLKQSIQTPPITKHVKI